MQHDIIYKWLLSTDIVAFCFEKCYLYDKFTTMREKEREVWDVMGNVLERKSGVVELYE